MPFDISPIFKTIGEFMIFLTVMAVIFNLVLDMKDRLWRFMFMAVIGFGMVLYLIGTFVWAIQSINA